MSENVTVNQSEARDEARRLTKVYGREIEASVRECCDFDRSCGCGGQGYRYLLIFSSCGHAVTDEGAGEDCEQRKCLQRETESFMEAMELAEEAIV